MQILFISFFFPPHKAIASVRTYNICKALVDAGHSVEVVTCDKSQLPATSIDRSSGIYYAISGAVTITPVNAPLPELYSGNNSLTKFWSLQSLRSLFARLLSRAVIFSGWDPMILWAFAVWRMLKGRRKWDAVVVSMGPFSSMLPAFLLARASGKPLILDYRDVWNGAPHGKMRISTRCFERHVLRRSALLVSVSESCLRHIIGRESGIRNVAITNGVSEQVFKTRKMMPDSPAVAIVYTGAFYPPMRSAEPILAVLNGLFSARESYRQVLRFQYYGPSESHVRELASRLTVQENVDCFGVVCQEQSWIAQARSICTVIITSVGTELDDSTKGIVTGKLFEALNLAPYVLIVSPKGSDIRSLTAGLHHVMHFSGFEIAEMCRAIRDLVEHRLPRFNRRDYMARPQYFSWGDLRPQYADALKSALE